MQFENPNQKGTLGEIAVCKELIQSGFSVFTEAGGHSKLDLIVLDKDFKVFKIQVKAVKSKEEVVTVYSIKTCLNPKYNSVYTVDQIDIFAIYVTDRDLVFYVQRKKFSITVKFLNSDYRLAETGREKMFVISRIIWISGKPSETIRRTPKQTCLRVMR